MPEISSSLAPQNVVFIVLDTHRFDRLGMYGYHRGTSPNLDEFARSAAVFERAIAPAQWTIPSHASMFTGLPPGTHLTTQANSVLDERFLTFAELLADAGYETTAFCNNPLVGVVQNNLKRGFQNFYNYSGATPNIPGDFPDSSIFPFVRIIDHMADFIRRVLAPVQNKFATSNELLQAATNPFFVPLWTKFVHFKGNTSQSTGDVARYLRRKAEQPRQQPFLLFLNLMETHLPFMPPREYALRFAPYLGHEKEAAAFMARFNRLAMQWLIPLKQPFREHEARTLNDLYDAEVAYQDHLLGQVLEQLERPALRDHTQVIFVADHGEMLGEHEFMGHGFGVYRELIQVPLIIRQPGQASPARISQPVLTTRLFHTVLSAAGITQFSSMNGETSDVRQYSLVNEMNGLAGGAPSLAVISEAYAPQDAVSMMERFEPELIAPLHTRAAHRAVYSDGHKLYDIEGAGQRLTTGDDGDLACPPNGLQESLSKQLADFNSANRAGRPDGWTPAVADLSNPMIEQRLRDLGYLA